MLLARRFYIRIFFFTIIFCLLPLYMFYFYYLCLCNINYFIPVLHLHRCMIGNLLFFFLYVSMHCIVSFILCWLWYGTMIYLFTKVVIFQSYLLMPVLSIFINRYIYLHFKKCMPGSKFWHLKLHSFKKCVPRNCQKIYPCHVW